MALHLAFQKPCQALLTLPALSPLGSSNLATLKSKQIREISIPINWSRYIFVQFLSYLIIFFLSFMNGHQLHYDGFLYICIVTFQNTYKPEIFHKYIAWFSLNSKKIHHYLLLNKTQKDGPHPIWKQLQKAAHCQENLIIYVKEEPQAVESKWVNLRVYLFSIQNYVKQKYKQINGK